MKQQVQMNVSPMYLNGEWITVDAEPIVVMNPATQEIVGAVSNGGEAEATVAIEGAHTAFQAWSQMTAYERAIYLKKLHQLMIEQEEEIATIMTKEMGKPIKEARAEVLSAASYLEWYAEEGKRLYGETIPTHHLTKRLQVWKKPVGVVAAITPWNFPVAMLTRKMGPALAAGCTIVIKPSSESPFTALKIAQLCEAAGFPKGVVHVVTGSSSKIGQTMMAHEKVRKVTFTGSTAVGKKLIEQSAQQVKRLSLELGGHAPVIILNDANLPVAIEAVRSSAFRNAGQTCVCANRIYVQSGIYETFVQQFADVVAELKVGNGLEEQVEMGPLINEASVQKVAHHVADALEKGATLLTGGERCEEEKGYFFLPTVLADVTPEMVVMREETFGPIAPIQRFETIEEVITLANDTPYGLAAYVFTEKVTDGMKLIEQLDYGIVGWNDGVPSATQAPFGGMKESGYGREGGREGIEAYLESQYVSIGFTS